MRVADNLGAAPDPDAPKPVGGYTETILRLIDVVFQAVAQIAPERSNGCAYGTINALSVAGHRQDGRRRCGERGWVAFEDVLALVADVPDEDRPAWRDRVRDVVLALMEEH